MCQVEKFRYCNQFDTVGKNYVLLDQFKKHEIKCGNVQFWIQQQGCASSFQLVNQISLLASVYTFQNVSQDFDGRSKQYASVENIFLTSLLEDLVKWKASFLYIDRNYCRLPKSIQRTNHTSMNQNLLHANI